ncbi:hypothetical protein H0O01_04815 [Candidatus Micrarchaeota archaeon]|nr:hypothetical protein [Candidatus Micrarchaeota archaeon]
MVGRPHLAMFVTDLHGNRRVREAAFRRAAEAGVKTLIIGGDLNPKKIHIRLNDGGFLFPDTVLLHGLIHSIRDGTLYSETPKFPFASDSDVDAYIDVPHKNASRKWLQSAVEGIKWLSFWPHSAYPPHRERILADLGTLDQIVIPSVRKALPKDKDNVFYRAPTSRLRTSFLAKEASGYQYDIFSQALMQPIVRSAVGIAEKGIAKLLSDMLKLLESYGKIEEAQRRYVRETLLPSLREFSASTGANVFIMPGNDDVLAVEKELEEGSPGRIRQINQKAFEIEAGVWIAGYSAVSFLSDNVTMRDWVRPEGKVADDLRRLASLSDPTRTIYSIHVPPSGVPFSRFYLEGREFDGGSTAVREFITLNAPRLTLHGHIHSGPDSSGVWKVSLAPGSISANPGANQEIFADTLIFDIHNPENMQRVKIPLI